MLGEVGGGVSPAEVVVYFADEPRRLYQLRQWLPVFEWLDRRRRVLLVTRDAGSFHALGRLTGLARVLVEGLPELVGLYAGGGFKVVVYVNNSALNFHSLAARQLLHVHVNHGESDKSCMVSNQVKAYDRVFVAGPAAVDRYRRGLLELDPGKLVLVGRPQLDLPRARLLLPPSPRPTVLYAPTWEGEHPGDRYTSLDRYGVAIVSAALAVPGVRVVYKPHPRIATTADPYVAAAHRQIVELLARADPAAGHRVLPAEADILAVLPVCDLLIADVSSVGPDFLYLRPDRPLFLTDRYDTAEGLAAAVPLSSGADVINSATLSGLARTLATRLAQDEHAAVRAALRLWYFGDLAAGESTARFLAAIEETIAARDQLLDHPAGRALARSGEVRVVILAAGLGTRLGLASPKPLTVLADGRSILRRQLDLLRDTFGNSVRVTVVVGHQAEEVMGAAPEATFVYNEQYAQTNTAVSLHKALLAAPPGGVLWLNGDVVFDGAVLERVRPLVEAGQSFACVNRAPVGEEEVTYTVNQAGWVRRLGKRVEGGLGEAVGINYIALQDRQTLTTHLARCSAQDYFEAGLEAAIADGLRVTPVDVTGCLAVEVDFAEDLERANEEVGRTVTSAA